MISNVRVSAVFRFSHVALPLTAPVFHWALFSLVFSLTLFLFPFNKLLARLSGFIVFPLDAALFIPHSSCIKRGYARTEISLGTHDKRKKREKNVHSQNAMKRKKNAVIRKSEENDGIEQWRWKRWDKRTKRAWEWAVTALRYADFAKRIAVFVGDSHWNVSHPLRPFYAIPRFCEGDASRRNLRSKSAIRSLTSPTKIS